MGSGLNNFYEFGNFKLDTSSETLWRDGELVSLSPKAMGLLRLLIEREGGIVAKQEIFDRVWAGTFVEEGVLTQNIYTLRSTLGQDENGKQFIETVRGRGYRFAARIIVDGESGIVVNGGGPAGPLRSGSAAGAVDRRPVVFRTVLLVGIGIVMLAAGAIGIFRWFRPAESGRGPEYSPIEQLRVQRLTDSGDVIHPTVSPDGKTLAYVRVESDGQSLWIKQIATGGSFRTLPTSSTGYRSLAFSPDGKNLFFREQADPGSILQTTPYGGPSKKVAENVWGDFSISPDGLYAAFVRRDTTRDMAAIVITNLAGGEERELSSRSSFGGYGTGAPAWSPDGRKIVVFGGSMKEARPQLVEVDVESGAEAELPTPKWTDATRAVWMPNGKQIVVAARAIEEPTSQLWLIDLPNGQVRRLTNDLETYFWISVSADGKMLVTRQQRLSANLWLFEGGDPNKARQLTVGERNLDGWIGVAAAPDARIIFTAFDGKATDLFSMNADGSGRVQLTTSAHSSNTWPSMANGGRVAFTSNRSGGRQVWVMEADGTNQRQLTFGEQPRESAYAPAIAPDGSEVFFIKLGVGRAAVWKASVDGGEATQVSRLTAASVEAFLSISPDGKWIAYRHVSSAKQSADEEGATTIGVISSDGAREPKLFNLPLRRPMVQWAADSQSFYYSAGTFNSSSLWRQPLDGSKAEKLFDLPDRLHNFAWTRDGKDLIVSRGRMIGEALLITNFSE